MDFFFVKHEVIFDLLTLNFLTLGSWIRVIIVINCPQIVIIGWFDSGILIVMVFNALDTLITKLSIQYSFCLKIAMRLIVIKVGTF